MWGRAGDAAGPALAAHPRGAHRAQGSGAGDGGAALPVPGVRARVRGLPPFAPAYAHYTHGLADFVCELSRFMTLSEVAALAPPGWDTVKEIVKADLRRRYARIPLREVRRLAIDEIHLGRKMKFAAPAAMQGALRGAGKTLARYALSRWSSIWTPVAFSGWPRGAARMRGASSGGGGGWPGRAWRRWPAT